MKNMILTLFLISIVTLNVAKIFPTLNNSSLQYFETPFRKLKMIQEWNLFAPNPNIYKRTIKAYAAVRTETFGSVSQEELQTSRLTPSSERNFLVRYRYRRYRNLFSLPEHRFLRAKFAQFLCHEDNPNHSTIENISLEEHFLPLQPSHDASVTRKLQLDTFSCQKPTGNQQ